jgi:phage gp29-like protein
LGSTSDVGNLGGKGGAGLEIQEHVTTSEAYKVAGFYSEVVSRAVKINRGPSVLPPKIVIVKDNFSKRSIMLALLKEAKALGIPIPEAYAIQIAGLPVPKNGEKILGGTVYSDKIENPQKETNANKEVEINDKGSSEDKKGASQDQEGSQDEQS